MNPPKPEPWEPIPPSRGQVLAGRAALFIGGFTILALGLLITEPVFRSDAANLRALGGVAVFFALAYAGMARLAGFGADTPVVGAQVVAPLGGALAYWAGGRLLGAPLPPFADAVIPTPPYPGGPGLLALWLLPVLPGALAYGIIHRALRRRFPPRPFAAGEKPRRLGCLGPMLGVVAFYLSAACLLGVQLMPAPGPSTRIAPSNQAAADYVLLLVLAGCAALGLLTCLVFADLDEDARRRRR